MNKFPNISLNATSPKGGLVYKIDLNLSLLLPELQETFGIDFQSVIIPLLLRFIRSQIKSLEKTIQNKKKINWLTEVDELELTKLKNDEEKLQIFTN